MGVLMAVVAIAIAVRVLLDTFDEIKREVDRHNHDAGKHM